MYERTRKNYWCLYIIHLLLLVITAFPVFGSLSEPTKDPIPQAVSYTLPEDHALSESLLGDWL